MTDEPKEAPERIWLHPERDWTEEEGVEYVRADLYAALQARIAALEAQIAALDPDNYEAQVQRWERGTAILRGEKP